LSRIILIIFTVFLYSSLLVGIAYRCIWFSGDVSDVLGTVLVAI